MARKKDSPQKAVLRQMMNRYLKENDVKVKDGTEVNSIMLDMTSIILEGALNQEMDEELGYSKYDYRNKDTDNSRNGNSQKTMHTSYGDMKIDIPRDRKGEFEPQIVKKYQNTVTQEMEEKIICMLNGLKNRGVEDIPIACVDGLTGFPQAIEAVYPETEIQQCIIHQIWNTTKFVSYKEIKPLMADLKRVYVAPTEEIALAELDRFDEKWSGKYPKIAKSWKDNCVNLSTYFKYPEAVRRLIYTTNTIEAFNR